MTTQHTPGPWKAVTAILNVAKEGDPETAHIVTTRKWGAPNIAEVTTEANARLIAAAPALLEALEAILQMEDEHATTCATQPTWASGRATIGPCDCCYGRARHAIAQAKGE